MSGAQFHNGRTFVRAASTLRQGCGQTGMSLIIVLMILVVVSLLGISAAQLTTMAERTARNDRDAQMAWEGAESGLVDAEFDMRSARKTTFGEYGVTPPDITKFVAGCGASGVSQGLCQLPAALTDKPAWLSLDLAATTNAVPLGAKTGRSFPAKPASVSASPQPAKLPNYVIEIIRDSGDGSRDRSSSDTGYVFRVTSLGFGTRTESQAVVQMIFRN